ncbi:MAG TPA: redoxin domain-containing protein [Vicinamibacterales bacterium]
MKRPWILLSSLVVLAALTSLAFLCRSRPSLPAAVTSAPPSALVGVAPDFSVLDLQGHQVALREYRGRVVLVNFWATWCAPCLEEIPALMTLQAKYGARELVVLGLAMDDDASAVVAPFVRDRRFPMPGGAQAINYPIAIGTDAVADSFGGVIGFPTTIFVSKDGQRSAPVNGPIDPESIERTIRSLLQVS